MDSREGRSLTTRNFVSHAHSDHVAGFESKTVNYSTIETKEIYSARGGTVLDFKALKFGDTVDLDDIEVSAYNAGHMLGSTQYKIQTPETSILYSGDINCVDTLTTKAAKASSCDVLILEATYGHPFFVFPEREDLYLDIIKWVLKQVQNKRSPVFQAYSAGKAQEIVKLLNTFTEIPVVTHPTIAKVNTVYTKYGISLDFINSKNEEGKELIRKHQCVYVIPTSRSSLQIENAGWAIVTGWALKFKTATYGIKAAFPLSSHADFIQLKNYVEEASPRKVYTVHGYKEEFANYIHEKLGINAKPLTPLHQRRLGNYL